MREYDEAGAEPVEKIVTRSTYGFRGDYSNHDEQGEVPSDEWVSRVLDARNQE